MSCDNKPWWSNSPSPFLSQRSLGLQHQNQNLSAAQEIKSQILRSASSCKLNSTVYVSYQINMLMPTMVRKIFLYSLPKKRIKSIFNFLDKKELELNYKTHCQTHLILLTQILLLLCELSMFLPLEKEALHFLMEFIGGLAPKNHCFMMMDHFGKYCRVHSACQYNMLCWWAAAVGRVSVTPIVDLFSFEFQEWTRKAAARRRDRRTPTPPPGRDVTAGDGYR